jgi:hypothetical protein
MAYTPNKNTIDTLRDIYELEGSYAGVARSLNKGRRSSSKQFTARQVSKILKQENRGNVGGGYSKQNKALSVDFSKAQQRSLQRKSKETSQTYQKTYEESKAPSKIYDSIKDNIKNKRERTNLEIRELMQRKNKNRKAGQDTSKIDGQIQKKRDTIKGLQQFDDELDSTAKQATNYKDWKGMQDARTP